MSTEAIIQHHLGAFGAADLDELMSDFTEDAVLIAKDHTFRGKAEIRALFADLLGGLFEPGTYELELDRMEVEGDVGYIAWSSKNNGVSVPLGTDTWVMKDGKIAIQTFAALIVED